MKNDIMRKSGANKHLSQNNRRVSRRTVVITKATMKKWNDIRRSARGSVAGVMKKWMPNFSHVNPALLIESIAVQDEARTHWRDIIGNAAGKHQCMRTKGGETVNRDHAQCIGVIHLMQTTSFRQGRIVITSRKIFDRICCGFADAGSKHGAQDALIKKIGVDIIAFLHFGKNQLSSRNLDFNRCDELGCSVREAMKNLRREIEDNRLIPIDEAQVGIGEARCERRLMVSEIQRLLLEGHRISLTNAIIEKGACSEGVKLHAVSFNAIKKHSRIKLLKTINGLCTPEHQCRGCAMCGQWESFLNLFFCSKHAAMNELKTFLNLKGVDLHEWDRMF